MRRRREIKFCGAITKSSGKKKKKAKKCIRLYPFPMSTHGQARQTRERLGYRDRERIPQSAQYPPRYRLGRRKKKKKKKKKRKERE
jgi:hypothetical protein